MDLFNRKTQFKHIYRKVYRKVRDADHQPQSHRNKLKLARQKRVGQKTLPGNHNIPLEKSKILRELRSGPYIVTKKITKVSYELPSMQIQRGPKSSIAIISFKIFPLAMSYSTYYPITRSLSTMINPSISLTNMQKNNSLK